MTSNSHPRPSDSLADSGGALSGVDKLEPVPLRLTVTRGRLGLELFERVSLGPISVEHLALSFENLRFPLDLSGGVPVFRHRRGTLERILLTSELDVLRRWAESRMRLAFGPLMRPLDLWWIEGGIGVGVVRQGSVLAWDLLWAPEMDHARWVVANVRSSGLPMPALGEALRIMDTVLGTSFERSGRLIALKHAGQRLARRLLPAVGARAPAAKRVVFGPLRIEQQRGQVELDATLLPVDLNRATARATELASLVRVADDALASGDLASARNAYLEVLERAPRHPEIAIQIAEIDRGTEARIASALDLVSECIPVTRAGSIGAELLLEAQDVSGAVEALRSATQDEVYAPLAAMWLHRIAKICDNARESEDALNAAVARSPSLEFVRLERLRVRARRGDIEGALSDAEQLEALARGSARRYEICRLAAEVLLEAGFDRASGRLYQRCLRYLPDNAIAMLGLGRALLASGAGERALPLFRRAVEVMERDHIPSGAALIELARLVARQLNDLPQAVARLRQVTFDDPTAARARALEAEYRCRLGDLMGASQAYVRYRELVELGRGGEDIAGTLLQAARFEREVMHDPDNAERHLAVGLRVAPDNLGLSQAYRSVAALLLARSQRLASRQEHEEAQPVGRVDEETDAGSHEVDPRADAPPCQPSAGPVSPGSDGSEE